MLGKILDFICTRLRSTEIALDSLSLVQYDFCKNKTRANKIPYFTKHCRITYYTPNGYIVPAKFGVHFLPLTKNVPKRTKLHLNEIGLTKVQMFN